MLGLGKFCFFAVLLGLVSLSSCYLDGWASIELYHSLGHKIPESFTFRGNISISTLNSELTKATQESLSSQQVRELKSLAEHNDFYTLRVTIIYSNGIKQSYLTSTKACGLIQSQLSDVLWISIDGSGFVTGVALTPTTPEWKDCSNVDEWPELVEFDTDVLIRHQESAPLPDTASFIQTVERERMARERGEVRDNRGFFAKYWMYIVPVVLLVLISGATNQDATK